MPNSRPIVYFLLVDFGGVVVVVLFVVTGGKQSQLQDNNAALSKLPVYAIAV